MLITIKTILYCTLSLIRCIRFFYCVWWWQCKGSMYCMYDNIVHYCININNIVRKAIAFVSFHMLNSVMFKSNQPPAMFAPDEWHQLPFFFVWLVCLLLFCFFSQATITTDDTFHLCIEIWQATRWSVYIYHSCWEKCALKSMCAPQ